MTSQLTLVSQEYSLSTHSKQTYSRGFEAKVRIIRSSQSSMFMRVQTWRGQAESSHAAPVRGHAEAAGGFAATSRLGASGRRNQTGLEDGGKLTKETSERVLRNRPNDGLWSPEATQKGTAGSLAINRFKKDLHRRQNGGILIRSRKEQDKRSGCVEYPQISCACRNAA